MGCSNNVIPEKRNSRHQLSSRITFPMCKAKNIILEDYIMRALIKHNEFRNKHNIAELQNNPQLNEIAQECAENLHNKNNNKNYLVNIYNNSFLGQNVIISKKMSPEDICLKWYNEGANYDYKSYKYQKGKGHFTQIIWKKTKEVGFGFYIDNENIFYGVAVYYPGGNILGEYEENIQAPQ